MAAYVFLDKYGRMVLPKEVREQVPAEGFRVEVENKKLVFEPLLSLDELVGSAPKLDRRRLLKEHGEEVRRETPR